jgi:hypothetical protein
MRLPTIYNVREFVEAGGLMSYGPNFLDLYRRAADLNEAGANLGHTGWTPMRSARYQRFRTMLSRHVPCRPFAAACLPTKAPTPGRKRKLTESVVDQEAE